MQFSAFRVLTRLEQSFFALPFVLSGALLAWPGQTFQLKWLLIIPTFLLARISGMAFNQLIDSKIDALNPRTEQRMIPSGKVSLKEARLIAWSFLILFLVVSFQVNTLTALLAPFAAFLLYVYSYIKRVHYGCHFVLGAIHFLAPVMAYAVIQNTLSLEVLFLGAAACFAIAANDIIYALQDYEFDRRHQLFSIPARFGIQKSLKIAAFSHSFALLMLLMVGITGQLPWGYYFLIPVGGSFFFYHHLKLRSSGIAAEKWFFICTSGFSFSVFLFLMGTSLWRAM